MSMGVRKEGREVTRAVQGTPNQHCVNRPPPGVDRLLGGVLHGPLRLSAEQITDGRNVAFVLKKKESRREGGKRRRSSTSGRKRGLQLTSTWCIRTAGLSLLKPCSCISAGKRLPTSLALCAHTVIPLATSLQSKLVQILILSEDHSLLWLLVIRWALQVPLHWKSHSWPC